MKFVAHSIDKVIGSHRRSDDNLVKIIVGNVYGGVDKAGIRRETSQTLVDIVGAPAFLSGPNQVDHLSGRVQAQFLTVGFPPGLFALGLDPKEIQELTLICGIGGDFVKRFIDGFSELFQIILVIVIRTFVNIAIASSKQALFASLILPEILIDLVLGNLDSANERKNLIPEILHSQNGKPGNNVAVQNEGGHKILTASRHLPGHGTTGGRIPKDLEGRVSGP